MNGYITSDISVYTDYTKTPHTTAPIISDTAESIIMHNIVTVK